MTDILLQIYYLPQELQTHIYGFIHIEDRIKILKEQYYDKLISNNSVWYQFIEHMDEQLLENFNSISRVFPHTLGYSPKSTSDYSMIPGDDNGLYSNQFPNLSETIYYSRDKTRNLRHPFYDDIDCFIRRKFQWYSESRFLRIPTRRNPPKTYKNYLINNRTDILKNFENQYNLLDWYTYDSSFDRVYTQEVFKHLRTVIICINQPDIINRLENSKQAYELKDKLRQEKLEEQCRRAKEENLMKREERISRKLQNVMNAQSRKLLKQKQIAILEKESAERKQRRIAERNAIEIKKAQEKEAKRLTILVKQQEKDNVRKLREKLSRQKEQDKMLASTVKIMKSMFTIKPIQNTAADRVARKTLKEKLKRDKEYDRVDKEVKNHDNIFKVTKRRIKQKL